MSREILGRSESLSRKDAEANLHQSDLIWDCILENVGSAETCQKTIAKSMNAIQTILQDNIVELLTKLDAKVAPGGVAVLAQYAEYFDTGSDECEKLQNWGLIYRLAGTPLTAALRGQLNLLVQEANYVLRQAVETVQRRAGLRMTLVTADWDLWVTQSGGRFCRPGASAYADDPTNADVLFYKFDTPQILTGILKQRDDALPLDQLASTDARNMTVDQQAAVVEEMYMRLTEKTALTDEERQAVRFAVVTAAPMADQAHPPACTKSWLGNILAGLLP